MSGLNKENALRVVEQTIENVFHGESHFDVSLSFLI